MIKNLTKPTEHSSNFALRQKTQEFKLRPYLVTKILGFIISLLFIAHIIALLFFYYYSSDAKISVRLVKYFHLGNESNFPTFFSSVILLIAAGLLFCIYKVESVDKNKRYWQILSCIFLFLSFDEAATIHDNSISIIVNILPNATGIFLYAWVIPYGILVLAGGIYFLQFVLALPKRTRNLFFISGFIYVFGAMGFEFIEGYLDTLYGQKNVLYDTLVTIEEVLEMVGILLFIHAQLEYLVPFKAKLRVANNSDE